MRTYLLFIPILSIFFVAGCSLPINEGLEKQPSVTEEKIVPSENKTAPTVKAPEQRTDVILSWPIPTDRVTGFVVLYGYHPDKLNYHREVSLSELKISTHPKHGDIYIYQLKNIPNSDSIFVAIRAIRDGIFSETSDALKTK